MVLGPKPPKWAIFGHFWPIWGVWGASGPPLRGGLGGPPDPPRGGSEGGSRGGPGGPPEGPFWGPKTPIFGTSWVPTQDVTFLLRVFMGKMGFCDPIFLRPLGLEGYRGPRRGPRAPWDPPRQGGRSSRGSSTTPYAKSAPKPPFGVENPRKWSILGRFSLWLWWENLGQGLGFCNFRPGKLHHTGTLMSVRRDLL